jgi:hypothetical protein
MPQSPLAYVVSHWPNRIENFQTSASEFYDAVEQALDRRKLPNLRISRVGWNEGKYQARALVLRSIGSSLARVPRLIR